MGATDFYLLMLKDSEIKKYLLCLGDFSANNMKKQDLMGVGAIFFLDYRPFDTSNIINIHKYLMKKHNMK